MKGINIILVEESYTSKTSFIDKEQLFKVSINEKENKKLKNYKFMGLTTVLSNIKIIKN